MESLPIEYYRGLIQGFLIGAQLCMMLVFIVIALRDMHNTKKEIKQLDNFCDILNLSSKINNEVINTQLEMQKDIDKIADKVGINLEEDEDEQGNSN